MVCGENHYTGSKAIYLIELNVYKGVCCDKSIYHMRSTVGSVPAHLLFIMYTNDLLLYSYIG